MPEASLPPHPPANFSEQALLFGVRPVRSGVSAPDRQWGSFTEWEFHHLCLLGPPENQSGASSFAENPILFACSNFCWFDSFLCPPIM